MSEPVTVIKEADNTTGNMPVTIVQFTDDMLSKLKIRKKSISVSSFTASSLIGGSYFATVSGVDPRSNNILSVYNNNWNDGNNTVAGFVPTGSDLLVGFTSNTACTVNIIYTEA